MSKIRSGWFQRTAQQGVFMKIGTLPIINRSGQTQSVSHKSVPKNPANKYFVVGKSTVGGEEVVGG